MSVPDFLLWVVLAPAGIAFVVADILSLEDACEERLEKGGEA
jgi:hypothetical protein